MTITYSTVITAGLNRLYSSWMDPFFLTRPPGDNLPGNPFEQEQAVYFLGGSAPSLVLAVEGDPLEFQGRLGLLYHADDHCPYLAWPYITDDGSRWKLAELPERYLKNLTPEYLEECVEVACWEAFYMNADVEQLFAELVAHTLWTARSRRTGLS